MDLEKLKKHPKCYYSTDNGVLINDDCFKTPLSKIKNVDLILTDIPYGLNKKMQGGTWGGVYRNSDMIKWDYVLSQNHFDKLLKIGKIQIIFGANNYITPPSRCWIIWLKSQLPTLSDFEMAWTNIDFPSKMFKANRLPLDGKHPTQKSLDLIIFCIKQSKTTGLVCDPFAGSGTTGVACERLNRKWIMIEKEEKYCELAAKRINSLDFGLQQIKKGKRKEGLLY